MRVIFLRRISLWNPCRSGLRCLPGEERFSSFFTLFLLRILEWVSQSQSRLNRHILASDRCRVLIEHQYAIEVCGEPSHKVFTLSLRDLCHLYNPREGRVSSSPLRNHIFVCFSSSYLFLFLLKCLSGLKLLLSSERNNVLGDLWIPILKVNGLDVVLTDRNGSCLVIWGLKQVLLRSDLRLLAVFYVFHASFSVVNYSRSLVT